MKKLFTFKQVSLLLFVCLSLFLVQSVFAQSTSKKKRDVPLQGEWFEDKRSLLGDCPISAVLDETNLFIQNTSLRSNIVVRLLSGSEIVKEKPIPAGTAFVSINITDLSVGETYQLMITNQWGNCLIGEFVKE